MRRPGVLALIVVLGLGLRTWAWASGSALWLDEILLSRNILGLPVEALLTGPLYLDQVAPPGFLLLEKIAVSIFGPGERALRLVPFLGSVAGLLLFRRVAERSLDGAAVPIAVGLYALGIPFIRYAAEVKQYGLDAAAAALVLWLALELREREPSTRRLALIGVAGFAIASVSQASVLAMAGVGLAFLAWWTMKRDRPTRRALVVVMPAWAGAAVAAIVLGKRSLTPSTQAFMDDFWKQGFLPLPAGWPGSVEWLWTQAQSVFAEPTLLRYRWPPLFLAIAALGMVVLWRRRRDVALIVLGPPAIGLVAAAAQQYPFSGRLMLYLVPGLLLAIAAGAEWLRGTIARAHPTTAWIATAALFVPPVLALLQSPPPYDVEHHFTVLSHLARHRRPGDQVYVFPLTRIGVMHYGPRYGIDPGEWTTGVCEREDTRAYLRDVDRYRGYPRVWVISSGPRPYRVARRAVREYLGTIGARRDSLELPSLTWATASIELYDLSDSLRLRLADASSFPVQPMPADPRPGCRPWARPSPLDTLP